MTIKDGVSSLSIPRASSRLFCRTSKAAHTPPCSCRGRRRFKPRCPLPPGVSGHPACFSLSEHALLSPADGVLALLRLQEILDTPELRAELHSLCLESRFSRCLCWERAVAAVVIVAFGGLRQKNCGFQVIQGHIEMHVLKERT